MFNPNLTRRRFVEGLAAMAAASGGASRMSFSADGRVLRVRIPRDLQVIDPGYMVGGVESVLQYSCLGQLINIKKGPLWDWRPSNMVERAAWIDQTHFGFKTARRHAVVERVRRSHVRRRQVRIRAHAGVGLEGHVRRHVARRCHRQVFRVRRARLSIFAHPNGDARLRHGQPTLQAGGSGRRRQVHDGVSGGLRPVPDFRMVAEAAYRSDAEPAVDRSVGGHRRDPLHQHRGRKDGRDRLRGGRNRTDPNLHRFAAAVPRYSAAGYDRAGIVGSCLRLDGYEHATSEAAGHSRAQGYPACGRRRSHP